MKNSFQIISELEKEFKKSFLDKRFIINYEKVVKEIFIYPQIERIKYEELKIINKICDKYKLTYTINYLNRFVIYLKQKE